MSSIVVSKSTPLKVISEGEDIPPFPHFPETTHDIEADEQASHEIVADEIEESDQWW